MRDLGPAMWFSACRSRHPSPLGPNATTYIFRAIFASYYIVADAHIRGHFLKAGPHVSLGVNLSRVLGCLTCVVSYAVNALPAEKRSYEISVACPNSGVACAVSFLVHLVPLKSMLLLFSSTLTIYFRISKTTT